MFSKIPSVTLIYNRYKKASPTNKASVEIRITYDSRQKYISTGIMLYPHQWKNGIITNCPDAIQISRTLDKILTDVRKIIFDMMEAGYMDISSISEKLKHIDQPQIGFWEFLHQRMEVRVYGKTDGSRIRYERFLRFFRQWGKIQDFKDITETNIIAYDKYLEGKHLKNSSKWNNYHRFLNSFILDAIEAGFMQRNPYRWVSVERKRTDSLSKCLTPEEFRRLKTVSLPTKKLERVRDLFIFQTYTCLSYTDLRVFNVEDIVTIKGTKVYTGKRNKTTQGFTIPLLSPALEILRKYNGTLPILSNTKYNEYLKIIAQAAGIDKPLSTHWARHTGATLLLNEGVPMQIVSKICGHSSTRITEQIYAKLLDETVVDAVSGLSNL